MAVGGGDCDSQRRRGNFCPPECEPYVAPNQHRRVAAGIDRYTIGADRLKVLTLTEAEFKIIEAILRGVHALYALASRWGLWGQKRKGCREANLDARLNRVGIFFVILPGLHRAVADGMFTGDYELFSKRSWNVDVGSG